MPGSRPDRHRRRPARRFAGTFLQPRAAKRLSCRPSGWLDRQPLWTARNWLSYAPHVSVGSICNRRARLFPEFREV